MCLEMELKCENIIRTVESLLVFTKELKESVLLNDVAALNAIHDEKIRILEEKIEEASNKLL